LPNPSGCGKLYISCTSYVLSPTFDASWFVKYLKAETCGVLIDPRGLTILGCNILLYFPPFYRLSEFKQISESTSYLLCTFQHPKLQLPHYPSKMSAHDLQIRHSSLKTPFWESLAITPNLKPSPKHSQTTVSPSPPSQLQPATKAMPSTTPNS